MNLFLKYFDDQISPYEVMARVTRITGRPGRRWFFTLERIIENRNNAIQESDFVLLL